MTKITCPKKNFHDQNHMSKTSHPKKKKSMPPPKILPQSKIFHMSIHNYQIFPVTIHNKKISYISKIAIKKKFPHNHSHQKFIHVQSSHKKFLYVHAEQKNSHISITYPTKFSIAKISCPLKLFHMHKNFSIPTSLSIFVPTKNFSCS